MTDGVDRGAVGPDVALAPLLDEYKQLKAEQQSRIGFRDNFIYVTLGAIAAVGWGAVQQNWPHLLLLIPLACFALGWTYLRNDRQISEIRTYIATVLKPRVTRITGDSDIFGWEMDRPTDGRSNQRRWIQAFVDLGVFVLPGAVVAIALSRPDVREQYGFGPGVNALILLAGVMSAVLAVQFALYSEVRRPARPTWLRIPRRQPNNSSTH